MIGALLTPTLLAAATAAGLTAGFLAAFAHTVMPALSRADDPSFIATFQALDRAVYNAWFMVPFTTAPLLIGAGLVMAVTGNRYGLIVPLMSALVLALATVMITGVVHLPLNRELGDVVLGSGALELAEARARFERRWVEWNTWRAVTATGSLACLAFALLRVR
jgi:uncharacterized membrane protein